jgi:hypothetical protein
MSARRVEYHQGAVTDVKSAMAWYREHSAKAALDFIEELHRGTETIAQAPERWPLGENETRRFRSGASRSSSSIPNNSP